MSSSAWFEAEGLARRYFYKVDDRGALYLFNTKHKNVATALRDKAFLKQFWGSLRQLEKPRRVDVLKADFHLVSICGNEESFLEVLDDNSSTALVFTDLNHEDNELLYAGEQLKEPFDPSKVSMDTTGRLYHPILTHRHLGSNKGKTDRPIYGLLHPHLANRLLKDSLRQANEGFMYEYRGTTHTILPLKPESRGEDAG